MVFDHINNETSCEQEVLRSQVVELLFNIAHNIKLRHHTAWEKDICHTQRKG